MQNNPHILFDLDGTLGNTLPLCIAAFREAIEPLLEQSLSDEMIIETFGPSEEGTIRALVPQHYETGVERYLASYARLHKDYPSPFPGMPGILHDLKAHHCFVGLVTGKGKKSTDVTLDFYGLSGFFDTVKTGSEWGPVKKERIEEVIAETRVPRDRFLYVGDSPGDIIACRECGIKIAAAAWAETSDHRVLSSHNPDYLFRSVFDFAEFVQNLYGGQLL